MRARTTLNGEVKGGVLLLNVGREDRGLRYYTCAEGLSIAGLLNQFGSLNC